MSVVPVSGIFGSFGRKWRFYRIVHRGGGSKGVARTNEHSAPPCVHCQRVRHHRLAPVLAVRRHVRFDKFPGANETQVARQSDLPKRLCPAAVLVAALVAPTAYEIARRFDLDQEKAAGLLVQGFADHQSRGGRWAVVRMIGFRPAGVPRQAHQPGGHLEIARRGLAGEYSLVADTFPERAHRVTATRQGERAVARIDRTGDSRSVELVVLPTDRKRRRRHRHGAGPRHLVHTRGHRAFPRLLANDNGDLLADLPHLGHRRIAAYPSRRPLGCVGGRDRCVERLTPVRRDADGRVVQGQRGRRDTRTVLDRLVQFDRGDPHALVLVRRRYAQAVYVPLARFGERELAADDPFVETRGLLAIERRPDRPAVVGSRQFQRAELAARVGANDRIGRGEVFPAVHVLALNPARRALVLPSRLVIEVEGLDCCRVCVGRALAGDLAHAGGCVIGRIEREPCRSRLARYHEVFQGRLDLRLGLVKFLDGIKVGQLPRSMAMTPDAGTLYVTNSGGENISILNLDQLQVTGQVKFPPTPLFVNQALSTPGVIAAGLRGPLFIMNVPGNNGTSTATIWQIIGDTAVPRGPSQVIGTTNGLPRTVTGPVGLAATPGGEYAVLAGGDGSTYLYDALADDFVQARTLTSFQQSQGLGYYGPITAGPKGQYYVVNGKVLNQALDQINPAATGTTSRPVAALAQINATSFLRFTQPIRTAATQLATDAGLFEVIDANTALPGRASALALEGPLSQATTTGRATAISGRTVAVDSSGSTVYALSTSGLSIIPLDSPTPANLPRVNARGAVNLTSGLAAVAQNSLLSIYGANLGSTAQATNTPLPSLMGGTCVTLNNTPLPLFFTSSGQINAQIPPELATGNYALVVHSVSNKAASPTQTVTISKYAPAVFVDPVTKQVAILHQDGKYVNKDNPAQRDEPLQLYASGLGLTKGGKVTGGFGSPSNPLAEVTGVQLYFGDPTYSQSGIIVDWAGLAPGFVGLYQLNIRVPGNHLKGDALPVTLKIGGVSSASTGPAVPFVAVQ